MEKPDNHIDAIIEVGPGPAVLSKHLDKLEIPFYIIERDQDFRTYLNPLNIKEAYYQDALKFDWDNFVETQDLKGKSVWLVSNLPYNVGSPLFVNFLKLDFITNMTLMFQKEVGVKTFDHNDDMSSLKALSLTYFTSKKGCKVPPGAFSPPPKVDSIVVKYKRISKPKIPISEFSTFEKMLRLLFNSPRKKCRHALKQFPNQEVLELALTDKRPSTLSLEDIYQLYSYWIQKMIKVLLFILSTPVLCSVPDYYGVNSSSVASVGNANDESSIYQAPSLGSFQDNYFDVSVIAGIDNLNKIENVVVESPINSSSSSDVYGDVDPNKSRSFLSIQSQFDLIQAFNLKAAFMLISPTQELFTFQTTDYFEPEYSLYSTGLERIHGSLHLIHKLNEQYSMSIGAHFGIQGEGEAYIIGRSSSDPNGSSLAEVNLTAKPKAALIIGVSKFWNDQSINLKYQQKLYSEVKVETIGLTPTGLGSSIDYNLNLIAHQFFDPEIFNLTYMLKKSNHSSTISLEYQNWESYKSSKLELAKISGVITSSKDYNSFKINSPIIPRLSYSYSSSETTKYHFGFKYRPQIIKSKLNESSNLLDSSIYSYSFGQSFLIKNLFILGYGFQYKKLKKQTVTKTDKRENGSSGTKIGSPGYSVGGNILVIATNISWKF